MKKAILIVLLAFFYSCSSFAKNGEEILPILFLTSPTTTCGKVTETLGKPVKIEETKRKKWWYYERSGVSVRFCWDKKLNKCESVYIERKDSKKEALDERLSVLLKSGKTDIKQALTILGTPTVMTIAGSKQFMHYFYEHHTLRLFFKDNILVDFTLIGQTRYQ